MRGMTGYTSRGGVMVTVASEMQARLTTADDWCDSWRQGGDVPVDWASDNRSEPGVDEEIVNAADG